MEPEEVRKLLKKWAIIGAFFALAFLFYGLHWRRALIAYVLTVGILSVLAILIQSGRGGGLAASLSGVGGDSLLGARSATPIAKATYVMLGLFVVICMLIARLGVPLTEPAGLLPLVPAGTQRSVDETGTGMEEEMPAPGPADAQAPGTSESAAVPGEQPQDD